MIDYECVLFVGDGVKHLPLSHFSVTCATEMGMGGSRGS
jgi:hypothetical protein